MTAEKQPLPVNVCKVPVCDRPDDGPVGYCKGHYQRVRLGLSLNTPIRKRRTRSEMEAENKRLPQDVEDEFEIASEPAPEDLMRPLPDQQVAIDKLRKVPYRLCGDSMGVGKTVTGIGLDFAMRKDHPELADAPTLIISEKIGLDVWDYHLKAMGVPSARICIVDPTDRSGFEQALDRLIKVQNGTSKVTPLTRYYLVHWDVLKSIPQLTDEVRKGKPAIKFGHIIADEVHLVKNRKAIRTINLKRISAHFKTGLSGTPADDKPWDIWSILHWLWPKKYRSYWTFFENHVEYVASSELQRWDKWKKKNPGASYTDYRAEHPTAGQGYRVAIDVKNIPELHREIEPFYIRRTLREVAPDMPEKIHVMPPTVVKMGRQQRKEYDSMRDKAIALIGSMGEGEGFQLLAPAQIAVYTRLQQMSLATLSPEWEINDDDFVDDEFDTTWDMPKIILTKPSPKLDVVMNKIVTHEEESFVVFTQFRGMADLVEEECQRLKISAVKIHGGITNKDVRTSLVQNFQDGKSRVFVGTIAAAGKTITLTRANHVIFTDLSWNPSKNAQAEDRLWRRTQKNTVRVHTIQSEDSIDQLRLATITRKADMIAALLDPKGYAKCVSMN